MTEIDELIRRYLLLVLALAEHDEDYLDTYFGPESLREEAERRGKVDLESLVKETENLISEVQKSDRFEEERKAYLFAQLRAMGTTLRMHLGDSMNVAEKVENIYGFKPERVNEGEFDEANRILDDCLPGKGPITERNQAYEDSMRIPVENLESLCNFVIHELRERTRERFDLQQEERILLELVNDRPYTGYCSFVGQGQSRVEINTGVPLYLNFLPVFMAHELYPGHHTESCLKETHLIQEQGWHELWAAPSLSPQLFMAEMVATHARAMVMPDDELDDWFRHHLFPRSKIEAPEPGRPSQVEKAQGMLAPVSLNAVFMYWDDGAGEREIKEYIQRYRHYTEEEAAHSARWVMHPVYHVYSFAYYPSYKLLEEVLARSGNPHQVFGKLLKEAHLPAAVQTW